MGGNAVEAAVRGRYREKPGLQVPDTGVLGQKELPLLLLGNNVTNNSVIESLSVVICVQSFQLVYMFCKQVRCSVFSLRSMLVHEVTTQEIGWANRLGLGGCLISRGFSSPVITLIIDILKALH